MKLYVNVLIAFLVIIGLMLYSYGVWCLCNYSLGSTFFVCQFTTGLATVVTTIGAVLATNLGAVVGAAVTNPNSIFNKRKTWNPMSFFLTPEGYQIMGLYIYVLSLLAALYVWLALGGGEDIHPIIEQMSKSLLGVLVGILTAAFGLPKNKSSN